MYSSACIFQCFDSSRGSARVLSIEDDHQYSTVDCRFSVVLLVVCVSPRVALDTHTHVYRTLAFDSLPTRV